MLYVKKFLCMLLTVTMLLSVIVMGTGASYKDKDQIKHKEAVEKLASLTIMGGRENGNFDPQAYVTRAEMCKMLCLAMNRGMDPLLNPSTVLASSFNDTKGHWAEGYIEYCRNMGMVSGMGDGTFQPDDPITGVQAAKMMLVIMGYLTDYTGEFWILSVSIYANEATLYNNLENFDPKKPLCRDDAAQLIYNGMTASMVAYKLVPTGQSIFDKFYKGKVPDFKN